LDPKSHFDAKGQDSHHRATHVSASVVDNKFLKHEIRNPSTSPLPQRVRQPRLALPKPNDKVWGNIDNHLDSLLSKSLSQNHINFLPPQQSIRILEDTTYNFLRVRFGVTDRKFPPSPRPPTSPNSHSGMKMLRTTKKSLRKCYMELKRSGLAETPEGIKVKRHWANVTRKMNKLRVALKKTKNCQRPP